MNILGKSFVLRIKSPKWRHRISRWRTSYHHWKSRIPVRLGVAEGPTRRSILTVNSNFSGMSINDIRSAYMKAGWSVIPLPHWVGDHRRELPHIRKFLAGLCRPKCIHIVGSAWTSEYSRFVAFRYLHHAKEFQQWWKAHKKPLERLHRTGYMEGSREAFEAALRASWGDLYSWKLPTSWVYEGNIYQKGKLVCSITGLMEEQGIEKWHFDTNSSTWYFAMAQDAVLIKLVWDSNTFEPPS